MKRLPVKQPYEKVAILFRFGKYLGDATILSVDSVNIVDSKSGEDAADTMRASDLDAIYSQDCYIGIKAGSDSREYKITVKIVSSDTSRLELDAILPVLER